MFQSSPVGIAGMKPDQSIVSTNPSLIRLLGYTDDELLDQPLTKQFLLLTSAKVDAELFEFCNVFQFIKFVAQHCILAK